MWVGEFQFLIGRLETPREQRKAEEVELFQFLIGRLETVHANLDDIFVPVISIPHR